MPLCSPRPCACALQSTSLFVSGSGNAGDPWVIEGASPMLITEAERAALAGGDLFAGLQVWTTDEEMLWLYTGTRWKVLDQEWQTYTPAIGGTGWALGAGTAEGFFKREGDKVMLDITMVFGAGFTTSGSIRPTVSLPPGITPVVDTIQRSTMLWDLYDASTGVIWHGVAPVATATTIDPILFGESGSAVVSAGWHGNTPTVIAAGDEMHFGGWYREDV